MSVCVPGDVKTSSENKDEQKNSHSTANSFLSHVLEFGHMAKAAFHVGKRGQHGTDNRRDSTVRGV